MSTTWYQRRSSINHDWLKNEMLQLLGSGLDYCHGRFAEDGFESWFVNECSKRWRRRSGAVETLIADFETDMTPRRLLEREPLSRMNLHDRTWLGDVVHSCWTVRECGREGLPDLRGSYTAAEQAFGELTYALSTDRAAGCLRRKLNLLEQFDRRCRELSECLSALPQEVKPA